MKRFRNFILCLLGLLTLISGPAWAQISEQDQELAEQLSTFKSIVFDVRNARGGNGDVAAAYLFALEMITRYGYSRTLTFLMNSDEEYRLRYLAGDNDVFWSKVDIVRQSDTKWFRPADLYITMADAGEAEERRVEIIRHPGEPNDEPVKHARVLIDDKTVLIAVPVLGATETSGEPGSLHIGKREFSLQPPGLRSSESGIYYDSWIEELRGLSRHRTRQLIAENILPKISSDRLTRPMRLAIESTLSAAQRADITYGFAYGVSASEVSSQWNDYLAGLLGSRRDGKPIVLLTPSSMVQSHILADERLKGRVQVVHSVEFDSKILNQHIQKGKGNILILELPRIPHSLFAGLLASSDLPPVIAGDATMSAAIQLGRPFVSTVIAWNADNVGVLGRALESLTESERDGRLFRSVFDISNNRLDRARSLRSKGAVFNKFSGSMPFASENIINSAYYAREFELNNRGLTDISRINDPMLRAHILRTHLFSHPDLSEDELTILYGVLLDHPRLPDVIADPGLVSNSTLSWLGKKLRLDKEWQVEDFNGIESSVLRAHIIYRFKRVHLETAAPRPPLNLPRGKGCRDPVSKAAGAK